VQNVLTQWNTLPARRQVILILAVLAVFVSVVTLARFASQPSMALLYSGLEPDASGEVIATLQGQGVRHEVRGNAIFVPANERDQLRMTLATSGMPKAGVQGYEILDSLSGFGTTSQMFDAAYWRAKEGELARTIQASPHITAARVHISRSSTSAFRRTSEAKASITVTTPAGTLSVAQAQALRFLVSSAVQGLSPDDVSVIDDRGGLISDAPANGLANVQDRSTELKARVQRLLEARVGPGNAVVEVSVETVTDAESISERIFDPDSRVAISSETEERTTSSTDSGTGVTVASNLPDGDASASNDSSSENAETRQRINYEVSETIREITRTPGAIKRLSVAVLVNEPPSVDGSPPIPRGAEELEALRELVASAVGFDEARGDTITLRTLVFEPVTEEGSAAAPSAAAGLLSDPLALIQTVVLAVVALVLGLFVIRPLLMAQSSPTPGVLPAPDSADAMAIGSGEAMGGPDVIQMGQAALGVEGGNTGSELPQLNFTPMNGLGDPAGGGQTPTPREDDFERLKSLVSEKEEASVEILKTWMEERRNEETA